MSLIPAIHSFVAYENATFYKRIYFEVEGKIEDLTHYSSKMVIKTEANGEILLELTSPSGGIILGGEEGTIDITIVPSELETWKSAVYELYVTETTEAKRTDIILRGGFKIVPF